MIGSGHCGEGVHGSLLTLRGLEACDGAVGVDGAPFDLFLSFLDASGHVLALLIECPADGIWPEILADVVSGVDSEDAAAVLFWCEFLRRLVVFLLFFFFAECFALGGVEVELVEPVFVVDFDLELECCVHLGEVEHGQLGLAWGWAQPAADNLHCLGDAFDGFVDHDALDVGLVKAFDEDIAVAQHVDIALAKGLEDTLAFGGWLACVDGVCCDAGIAELAGEFLCSGDTAGEGDGLDGLDFVPLFPLCDWIRA